MANPRRDQTQAANNVPEPSCHKDSLGSPGASPKKTRSTCYALPVKRKANLVIPAGEGIQPETGTQVVSYRRPMFKGPRPRK